jgi:hypothetical protein
LENARGGCTKNLVTRPPIGKLISISLVALASATVFLIACGTDATGIEACRQIEEARCRKAPGCGVDMNVPPHRDSPKQDVEACVRYYRDACLHGMAVADPGHPQTQSCVDAILAGDCPTVLNPETHPACAFLIPPNTPPPDAAADAPPDAADDAHD